MKVVYGISPAVKASIDTLENGGSIPVGKSGWIVGSTASEPGFIPAKFAEILSCRLREAIRYHYAEAEYYGWHGNLPASDRTKRLRKKRRSIIMKWRYGK